MRRRSIWPAPRRCTARHPPSCSRASRATSSSRSASRSRSAWRPTACSPRSRPGATSRAASACSGSEAAARLAPEPVGLLPGVGPAHVRRLAALGVTRVGQLQALDDRTARQRLGDDGPSLVPPRPRRGRPAGRVPTRETKSISAETTFDTDLSRTEDLERHLWRLCGEAGPPAAREASYAAGGVVLKLKTARFASRTRAARLAGATAPAGPPVRSGPRPAGARGGRHRLPPDRHRRQRAAAAAERPISAISPTPTRRAVRLRRPRSTPCVAATGRQSSARAEACRADPARSRRSSRRSVDVLLHRGGLRRVVRVHRAREIALLERREVLPEMAHPRERRVVQIDPQVHDRERDVRADAMRSAADRSGHGSPPAASPASNAAIRRSAQRQIDRRFERAQRRRHHFVGRKTIADRDRALADRRALRRIRARAGRMSADAGGVKTRRAGASPRAARPRRASPPSASAADLARDQGGDADRAEPRIGARLREYRARPGAMNIARAPAAMLDVVSAWPIAPVRGQRPAMENVMCFSRDQRWRATLGTWSHPVYRPRDRLRRSRAVRTDPQPTTVRASSMRSISTSRRASSSPFSAPAVPARRRP